MDLLVPAICPIDAEYHESRKEMEMKTHFHNSFEIIYVVEGKALFCINGTDYTVCGNSLIFINNMEKHDVKVLEYPYKRYFILIKPEYFQSVINEPVLSSIFKNRSENFRHVISLEPGKPEDLGEMIVHLYGELKEKKDFWEASVKSSLHILFIMLYRSCRTYFPLNGISGALHTIVEIQKHIEDHYLNEISLEDTARLFFMDKYYLSHLFRKATGFTFKEYLIRQRISKAKDLLFYTNEDITRVCMNSGFNNLNHFIRIFKKIEGTTPYQYRKKYR